MRGRGKASGEGRMQRKAVVVGNHGDRWKLEVEIRFRLNGSCENQSGDGMVQMNLSC